MLFSLNRLFSQNILLQDFKSESFEFKYPKKWKIDTVTTNILFTIMQILVTLQYRLTQIDIFQVKS